MNNFNDKLYDASQEQKLKLKPCPFCGGEAKVMDMGYPHWVYCKNCGAKIHGRTHDEKDSIAAWNRRVSSEALRDVPDVKSKTCKRSGNMTDEQRKLLTDAMDKSEDILVDLCCNNRVGWGSETYKDALIYLSRQVRLLSAEAINFDEKTREYERRISDLESELKMLIRG